MKVAVQAFLCLVLLALTAFLGELAYSIHQLRPKLEVTVSNADRALIAAGAAAGNLERASRAWEQASKEQSAQTTKAMSNVSAAAKGLSTFVSRTDASVNSSLFPQITEAIRQQNAALLTSQNALQSNLSQIAQATTQLQKTLADADKVIADPAIKESVDSLAFSSQNLVVATSEGAASMQDVHKALDYEIHELTKPVSKLKAAMEFAATIIGKLYGF
jgi:hypothetical protein